jgi:peptidoglycan hydrolase CwlO-like protein
MSPALILIGFIVIIMGVVLFLIMRGSPKMNQVADSILTEKDFSEKDTTEVIKQHQQAERSISNKKKEISKTKEKIQKEEDTLDTYSNTVVREGLKKVDEKLKDPKNE